MRAQRRASVAGRHKWGRLPGALHLRLLGLQAALKATLYGRKQRIDIPRLQRLASGFSRFTVDGIAAPPPALVGCPACTIPLRPLLQRFS